MKSKQMKKTKRARRANQEVSTEVNRAVRDWATYLRDEAFVEVVIPEADHDIRWPGTPAYIAGKQPGIIRPDYLVEDPAYGTIVIEGPPYSFQEVLATIEADPVYGPTLAELFGG